MARGGSSNGTGKKQGQKKQAKEYERYVKQFTPRPNYVLNGIKAFTVGGLLCVASLYAQETMITRGMARDAAGVAITVILICLAQLITGFGWFDSLAKFAGAGVIVPITGFANSMVSPAMEYKKEGPVLGAGAKLFSLAGPVLVLGITSSVIIGMITWIFH